MANKYALTTHHLVPQSRTRNLGLYPHDPRNIIQIPANKHEAIHLLFQNWTPEEILLYVANNFVPDLDYYGHTINNKAVRCFLAAVKNPMGSR